MRELIFSVLILFSVNSYADNSDQPVEENLPITESPQVEEPKQDIPVKETIDTGDKEVKVNKCIDDYVKKQSRPYTKITQDNLYYLIYDFDRISLKIYGKKLTQDDISREEKIEALAKVQCEAYYKLGILK